MKAFHNNVQIKKKYLKRVRDHAKLDQIVKGQYWENGKGCAVGCTIHSDRHSNYETELGIPTVLARLEDRIFEGLDNKRAMLWPEQFLSAIKTGADLSKVWPKFAIFLLTDKSQCDNRHSSCELVAKAYQDELDGVRINWMKVRRAASAADAAVAAYAAATYAAAAAVDAAAVWSASMTEAYDKQADMLLKLLKEAK